MNETVYPVDLETFVIARSDGLSTMIQQKLSRPTKLFSISLYGMLEIILPVDLETFVKSRSDGLSTTIQQNVQDPVKCFVSKTSHARYRWGSTVCCKISCKDLASKMNPEYIWNGNFR